MGRNAALGHKLLPGQIGEERAQGELYLLVPLLAGQAPRGHVAAIWPALKRGGEFLGAVVLNARGGERVFGDLHLRLPDLPVTGTPLLRRAERAVKRKTAATCNRLRLWYAEAPTQEADVTDRPETGIETVIRLAGSQAALAKALGVRQQSVSEWLQRGYVPIGRVVEIEATYGVPRTDLVQPGLRDLLGG